MDDFHVIANHAIARIRDMWKYIRQQTLIDMAKTIKELYDKAICKAEFSPEPSLAFAEGFELGANAVIEELENVIKADRILGHPFPSLEMRYNQIISVIEQLRKEK